MLACLLIENLNDCLGEVISILDFYTPTHLAPKPLKTERPLRMPLSDVDFVMPGEIPACPHCEIADDKSVYIDLEVDAMTTKANEFVKSLLIELKESDIQARIGIATNRFVSFVAAHRATLISPRVVPPAEMALFLADQSVSLLPILPETLRRLDRLGLRNLGQVANMEKRVLINQFGKEGELMSELSQGIDSTPLSFYRPPLTDGRTAWQRSIWGDETTEHVEPVPATIISKITGGVDLPQAILHDNKWIYFDGITDHWKVEDRWWTENPQDMNFFTVLAFGAELTVSHNLAYNDWSRYKHGLYGTSLP